jgi:hypothetical protein
MIPHGQMRVVGLESVVGSSKEAPNVESVVFAGVKVGVVTNVHRQMHGDLVTRDQAFLLKALLIFQSVCVRRVLAEDVLEVFSDRSMNRSAQRGELVEGRLGETGNIESEC